MAEQRQINVDMLKWFNNKLTVINDESGVFLTKSKLIEDSSNDIVDWNEPPYKSSRLNRVTAIIYLSDDLLSTFIQELTTNIFGLGGIRDVESIIDRLALDGNKLGTMRTKNQRYVFETIMIRTGLPTSDLLFGRYADKTRKLEFNLLENYGLSVEGKTRYYIKVKGVVNRPTDRTATGIVEELRRYKRKVALHNNKITEDILNWKGYVY